MVEAGIATYHSTPFHKLCGEKWQFEIVLYFILFEAALKSKIRIPACHALLLAKRNICYRRDTSYHFLGITQRHSGQVEARNKFN